MRKLLIKHLVLCAVFQASVLFGMQPCCYGTICSSEIRRTLCGEVVEDAFQEGNICLDEVFQKFNNRKTIEGVNLLFHSGNLYINRFFPLNLAYEGIEIQNKKYVSLQVSDILEFDKEKIIALQQIKEGVLAIRMMKKNLKPSGNSLLQKLYEVLQAASILDSKFKKEIEDKKRIKGLSDKVLEDIYSCAQKFCKEYVDKIASYISSFDETDGNNFNKSFEGGDILLKMQSACIQFKQYAHTEYMLKYRLFKNPNVNISSVSFVSYYDMCDNCENLWAGIAKVDLPVKVVSCQPYYSSRSKDRGKGNPNLMLAYSSK